MCAALRENARVVCPTIFKKETHISLIADPIPPLNHLVRRDAHVRVPSLTSQLFHPSDADFFAILFLCRQTPLTAHFIRFPTFILAFGHIRSHCAVRPLGFALFAVFLYHLEFSILVTLHRCSPGDQIFIILVRLFSK